MGFCRSLKKTLKAKVIPEVKQAVKAGGQELAASIIGGLSAAVADGRISKDEAEGIGKDALQRVHGISRTAASLIMNGTHEAIKAGLTDLADDVDTDGADIEAALT